MKTRITEINSFNLNNVRRRVDSGPGGRELGALGLLRRDPEIEVLLRCTS